MRFREVMISARLLRAVASLAMLETWPHMGARLENIKLAFAGEGGLTEREVRTILLAASRWESVDPRLRELYSQNLEHRAVQSALWLILFSEKPSTPGAPVYGVLRTLWLSRYGYSPPIELIPRSPK